MTKQNKETTKEKKQKETQNRRYGVIKSYISKYVNDNNLLAGAPVVNSQSKKDKKG